MSDNTCTDCRDAELVTDEERAARLCYTCQADQRQGE